jgi:hypothetical protein
MPGDSYPGNAPSHTDAAVWIDKAIAHVQPHAPRVCVRGDTDFSLTAHCDRWSTHVDLLFDQIRYFFYITTRTDLSPACSSH